jgi:hypothetical protein
LPLSQQRTNGVVAEVKKLFLVRGYVRNKALVAIVI